MNDFLSSIVASPWFNVIAYKVIVSVLILVGVGIGVAAITKTTQRFSRKHPQAGNILSVIKTVLTIAIWVVGVLMILQTFGVAIAPILAALGVGGLAVALAVKDTLENLFAGLQILISHQIKVGDTIEIDASHRGKVIDIMWRYTVLEVGTNERIIIPNAKVAESIIKRIRS